MCNLFFFFSSRRRHTRYWRDWSSDVCSSDLLGALVSGLIGALALNLIDKLIAQKLKIINTQQQIEKKNEILATQSQLNKVVEKKVENTRNDTISSIKERHAEAADIMKDSINKIMSKDRKSVV